MRQPSKKPQIKATATQGKIIAISAPVTITAATGEGEDRGPATFSVVAYTGQAMRIKGWDHPVVVEIEGMEFDDSLTANLDHDPTKRVGHVTEATKHDGKVLLAGVASAVSSSSNEVVSSGKNKYPWKASIEADPLKVVEIPKGKTFKANGQTFTGPAYHVTESLLSGFGFVTRGADSKTTVAIAASAASTKGNNMKAEVKEWAESMGIVVDNATPEFVAAIEANYAGKNGKKSAKVDASNPFESRKLEATRRTEITSLADSFAKKREDDLEYIEAIETMRNHAIEAGMSTQEFRNEMYESMVPLAHTVPTPKDRGNAPSEKVIEAAIALAGRLANVENVFDERTLEAADKHFKDGISLSELFFTCAEANGYRGRRSGRITLEVQAAAFARYPNGQKIHGQGWSTLSISNILSNNQNKFLREGWNSVDQTILRIAAIRPVSDFREITTVALTGGLMFEKVGAAGEIKHGTLGDTTYGNKADTYAIMLAITRQDMVNDDLGALNAVPKKIGRGGMLKLNDIGWTEFLNPSVANFFHTNNANVSTVDGTVSLAGLDQANVIFSSQTDPDGFPIGSVPKIWLVPTAQDTAARHLMNDELILGSSGTNGNIWRGRFQVESSPYMHNTAYTGYSATASYLIADPSQVPVIEIVALNGRVEPQVDTADTDFNTLGVQFRGYSDVGVRMQEPRGAVRLDGSAA